MAQITITVPDAAMEKILRGMHYNPADGLTPGQHAKAWIITHLKAMWLRGEIALNPPADPNYPDIT